MRVTKIEPVPGLKNSFNVFFDNDMKLRCYLKNISDFDLAVGSTLDETQYRELENAVALSRTRQRAAQLISTRQMSAGELYKRLIEKGEPEQNAANAVAWLSELRALDDAEYAAAVARHYANKGYGKAKIKDEFYKRIIPRALWDDALEEYAANEGALDKYIRTKLRSGPVDQAGLKKAANGLYRRGFSWDEIKDALRRYEQAAELSE
jgi:regulatory protein